MTFGRRTTDSPQNAWQDGCRALKRDLILLHVDGNDGVSFDVYLTRVPGIGEEIIREDRTYKVLRVRHEAVDDDGKARFGWHAFIEGELQPAEEEPPKKRRNSGKQKRGGQTQPRRRS